MISIKILMLDFLVGESPTVKLILLEYFRFLLFADNNLGITSKLI